MARGTTVACMAALALQFGLQPLLNRAFAGDVRSRSLLVVVCEGAKLALAAGTLALKSRVVPMAPWSLAESVRLSGLPAVTYAVQNVLIQLSMQHLSPLEFNLINQTKLLWTAVFVYLLLHKPFSVQQCGAMVMLVVASVLLSGGNADDADVDAALTMDRFYYGYVPVVGASVLSGVGAALTQQSLQTHGRDASVVTMELCVYGALFLVANLVASPGAVVDLTGWTPYTLIPVVTNAMGGLLVGTVTQLAGGIMKSYALIGGILLTGIVEAALSDAAVLSPRVYIATALVIASMYIYSMYPYVPKTKAKTA
ncbi:CMP-sialic acid transporter 5-like [Achlya hypogyna]|uniref:CMP-sialic acid transporter 5-like n=1 Tax=Achlya hypogyna TaxID=1202772 RepID=A0A1V9YP25_ACHHY|nr:CMP-sialic acid transporter 5-like [Achlya hypogyna]